MVALATEADVVKELGRGLTSQELTRLDAALESASDYVRTETGRRWEAGTFTVRRRARGGMLNLDSPATVTAVRSVDVLGSVSNLAGFTLRGSTVYGVTYNGWVEVTYTSTGAVPKPLVRVVAAMAARDLTETAPQGAVSYSVSKGPFSESATFDGPTDAVMPTPSEERVIRRYAPSRLRSVSII